MEVHPLDQFPRRRDSAGSLRQSHTRQICGRIYIETAVTAGGAALQALQAGLHEDVSLEIVIPAARALFAGAPPEMQGFVRGFLQQTLARIAQGTSTRKSASAGSRVR